MRTVEAIKAHLLEHLACALKRPAMYGGETVLWYLMEEIVYLDEREDLLKAKHDEWESRGYRSTGGISGVFWHRFGGRRAWFDSEAGSIYAEFAHELGYLRPERTLDAAEWKNLRSGARRRFSGRDWTLNEILEEYGPASFTIGWNWHKIICYSSNSTGKGWIFFDCEAEPPSGPSYNWSAADNAIGANPPLRDVRIPAKDFAHGLVLTSNGRALANRPIQYS
jgi:hypothetical protein